VSTERDTYRTDVEQLREKVKSLEAEVAALKTGPQETLKQAVEAREKGDFEQAAQLLSEVETKYPASPEAGKAPVERDQLKKAIAAKRDADRKAYEEAVAKARSEAKPEDSKAVLTSYLNANSSTAYRAEVEKMIDGYNEAIRIAAEEAKKPPVEIVAAEMGENSIGTPEINLTLRNVSRKVIDGFEFSVDLYDNYDRPVYRYRVSSDGNTFGGISQDKIQPGGRAYWTWTMYGFDLATKHKNFRIRSVHFTDGSIWRP
jgi:hypothetical protein